MIFGFNKQADLLDEESIAWIFDVFDWALTSFNGQGLNQKTVLVLPNNEYFPGRGSSIEGMAEMIFSQVKTYAGIDSIPCELHNEEGIGHVIPDASSQTELVKNEQSGVLLFSYHSHLLNNPEVLIASFAHQIAYYLLSSASNPPPGGEDNWPHAAELLATFMGFGIIMANTANTQKIRSCGSCSGPAVERESFLSQYDLTYALALFCELQKITAKETSPHLKKTLRTYFKNAHKEIGYSGSGKLALLQTAYLNH